MRFAEKIGLIFDLLDDSFAYLAGILVAFIGLATLYEVFMRYVLNAPSFWAFEIVEYSLLFLTFLSTTWLLRQEGHVTMDILLNRLGPRTQRAVTAVTSLICAMACLIIAIFGVKAVVTCYQLNYTTPTELELPQYSVVFIIPLGSFLLFIQFLRRASRSWRAYREGGQS